MAQDKLDYGSFNTEHSAINNCIKSIEAELSNANKQLQEATTDGSGQWAATDLEDWNNIYTDINNKFDTLQNLMVAAGGAVESLASTESVYAGLSDTVN